MTEYAAKELPLEDQRIKRIRNSSLPELNINKQPLSEPLKEIKNIYDFLEKCLKKKIETQQLVIKTTTSGTNNTAFGQSILFLMKIHFYSNIIPAIEQMTVNIPETERDDSFVRFCGSRLSLNTKAEKPDADAVILLENLKFQGYNSLSRWYKLDRDEIRATLKSMAYLHALTISMRHLQPTVYYSEIDPYLQSDHDTVLMSI
ncbi:uncharacterized protein LOC116351486 isoform X2 [Contarinia nasturtii]|uniref:uncharacterized protein LOC116351486 isoform X2 n=1 Tax=Contarinia nasturtii TaxID=265458 RepID=UPI0012D4A4EE|nr:uncharacterized protein LOC116351486 isoform X2 [Contarinia nasturtii]XP_031639452.1 uncharacterized protein LOC116351486 isoform X2 [Contarinia nasturtii]